MHQPGVNCGSRKRRSRLVATIAAVVAVVAVALGGFAESAAAATQSGIIHPDASWSG